MSFTSERNGKGLLLYHSYSSFYSQKVTMALLEKRLDYKSQLVQLTNFEQYQPEFMRLNPKGQIPVLCDGSKVIPDSTLIIDYLEENYSDADTPRLWPEDVTEFARVEHFRNLFDELPIEAITYGCLINQHMTTGMKIPPAIATQIIEANKKKGSVLESYAQQHPELAEHYNRKRNRCWQMGFDQESLYAVHKVLDDLEGVLDEVEMQLASNIGEQSDWWLCSQHFSVADIGLTVLLNRLDILGLSYRFWQDESSIRPHLLTYHHKLTQRQSYRRACLAWPPPTSSTGTSTRHRLKSALAAITPSLSTVVGGSVLLATALVAAAVLLRLRQ